VILEENITLKAKTTLVPNSSPSTPQAESLTGLSLFDVLDQKTIETEAKKYVQSLERESKSLEKAVREMVEQRKSLENRLEELKMEKSNLIQRSTSNSNGGEAVTTDSVDNVLRERREKEKLIEAEENEATQLEIQIRATRSTDSGSSNNEQLQAGVSYEVIRWEELEVGKQIGTGAFAEVFEAYRSGERVAVKRFNNQANGDEAKQELASEVTTMSQLHSNYVVSMYGACFDPPNMCIVMEFLARGSLFYLLSDPSIEMTWTRRWNIARDAAIGMAYLHSKRPPLLHKGFFFFFLPLPFLFPHQPFSRSFIN